jgi:hypothetical protein
MFENRGRRCETDRCLCSFKSCCSIFFIFRRDKPLGERKTERGRRFHAEPDVRAPAPVRQGADGQGGPRLPPLLRLPIGPQGGGAAQGDQSGGG